MSRIGFSFREDGEDPWFVDGIDHVVNAHPADNRIPRAGRQDDQGVPLPQWLAGDLFRTAQVVAAADCTDTFETSPNPDAAIDQFRGIDPDESIVFVEIPDGVPSAHRGDIFADFAGDPHGRPTQ